MTLGVTKPVCPMYQSSFNVLYKHPFPSSTEACLQCVVSSFTVWVFAVRLCISTDFAACWVVTACRLALSGSCVATSTKPSPYSRRAQISLWEKRLWSAKFSAAATWIKTRPRMADNRNWARTPTSALNLALRFLSPLREISVEEAIPDHSACFAIGSY